MSELAPETPDTPNVTPNEDTPDIPWQKRYEDLRPEFDRTNQLLASFKSDPNAVIEFIRETHPDLLDDSDDEPEEDPDEYVEEDPTADLRTRLDKFEQWQAQQEAEKAGVRFTNDLNAVAGDRTISKKGRDWIELETSRTGNNKEALEKAVESWFEDQPNTKKRPRVPHVPTTGQAATDVPNWDAMTPGEVNQYMAERVRANQAQ